MGLLSARSRPSPLLSAAPTASLVNGLATMNRISRLIAVAILMAGNTASVFACLPAPLHHYAKTETRVRERFDSVDSVVLVTLLNVEKIKKKEMEIEIEGERATFRIDRVFKGHARAGDKLILNTFSTCANYVAEWNGRKPLRILSRQWLIYRDQSDMQMPPHDLAQPSDFFAYDVKVLSDLVRVRPNLPR